MNRVKTVFRFFDRNFLYACGDEPNRANENLTDIEFSLRMWRWTENAPVKRKFNRIFSTHVEMNRRHPSRRSPAGDFLYACGDEPAFCELQICKREFSLRMWRWTAETISKIVRVAIFSTHVEMNRAFCFFENIAFYFLYACGDEPRFATVEERVA